MKKNYKNWNTKEINTVIDCIKRNPENLSKGFTEAALATNRTIAAIQFKYYQEIKPGHKELFTLKSDNKIIKNTKNIKRESNDFTIISFESMEQLFKNVTIKVGNKKIIAKEAIIC